VFYCVKKVEFSIVELNFIIVVKALKLRVISFISKHFIKMVLKKSIVTYFFIIFFIIFFDIQFDYPT